MIELVGKRTENAKTFDLGKGKFRTEICNGAVHYKDDYNDANEQFKNIDLTWKDNKITKAPYTLERIGNKIIVLDKKTGQTGTIELTDIGATTLSAASFDSVKTTEIVKDVDVEIMPAPDSIRFQTVIKDATALAELKYKVSGDIQIKYSAVDADGDSVPLAVSLKDGILTETVDAKSFTSVKPDKTAIKYPIKIDPTLTIQGAGYDTFLQKFMATTNYGTETYLKVRSDATLASNSILRMALSDIPVGATIDTATFSLYHYGTVLGGNPSGSTLTIYRCRRADWVEAEATWNIYKTLKNWGTGGAANTSTDIDTSLTATCNFTGVASGWMAFNVKSIVEDAITNSLEFNIRLSTDYTLDWPEFYSKEYATDTSLRPKLVIDYTPPAGWNSVTRDNMKISAIDGTAFVDFSTALILTAYTGYKLVIKDSAGKELVGYIKAAGTGETLGSEKIGGSWTNGSTSYYPYNTLTTSGADVTSAVNSYGAQIQVGFENATYSLHALYKVLVTLTLNSGQKPRFWIGQKNGLGSLATHSFFPNNGANTAYFTTRTSSALGAHGFYNTNLTNWSATGISFKQVLTPSATGVTIVSTKGGSTYNWASKDVDFNYYDASGYTYKIVEGAAVKHHYYQKMMG